MRARLVLIALLAAGFASAKTYTFTLSDATQAGSTKLNPGAYKLKVDGSKVMLKDSTGHNVAANAKVETAKEPYRNTEVSVTRSNGGSKLEWIGLAGSHSRVIFE